MLNLEQAKALFKKEAAQVGTKDHIPAHRVMEIFGKDALKFVILEAIDDLKTKKSCDYFCFRIGNDTVDYLNMSGFLCAASYANVREIKAMLDAKAATDGKAC